MNQNAQATLADLPTDPFERGCLLIERGEWRAADEAFEQCLARDATDMAALTNLVFVKTAQSDSDGVVAIYRRILAVDPDNLDALDRLADLLHQRNDRAGAIKLLTRAVQLDPVNREYMLNLTEWLKAKFQFKAAIEIAANYNRLVPDDRDAVIMLASLQLKVGHGGESMQTYRRYLERHPDDWPVTQNLTSTLLDQFRPDEAIALYESFCARHPDIWRPHHNFAHVLQLHGRVDEALALYRGYVARAPEDWEAHHNLALFTHGTGDPDAAIAVYLDWLARHPDDPRVLGNLGTVARWSDRVGKYQAVWQSTVDREQALFPMAEAGSPIPSMEYDFRDASPDVANALEALRHHGLVILRGAVAPALLADYRSKANADANIPQKGQAFLRDVLPELDDQLPLITPALRDLLAGLFGRPAALSIPDCYVRRVSVRTIGSTVPFHQDSTAFHRTGVNVWVPLDAIGAERPGLQLVARRVDTAFETSHAYDHNEIEESLVMTRFGDALVMPTLALGDIILFLSSTIHRSHVTADMTEPRFSMEIRWV